MQLTELNAVSPIDGRYRSKTKSLSAYFSEEALIKYRVLVEVEYFISMCEYGVPQLQGVDKNSFGKLRSIYENFSTDDALWIKETEKTTNHDVKAVEYFIKKKFDEFGLEAFKEFIHFGLTSQDINNTAIPLSAKEAFENVYLPSLIAIVQKLKELSVEWANIPLLARTHGQPASPTRLEPAVLALDLASASHVRPCHPFSPAALRGWHANQRRHGFGKVSRYRFSFDMLRLEPV